MEEFCTVRWRHRARLSTNFSLGGGGGGVRRGSRGPKPVFCRRPFRPIALQFEGFTLDCANRTVRRAAIVGGNLEEFCTVRWRRRARLSTNFSLGGGGGGARIQCERRPRGGSKPVHAVAERRHKPRHDALTAEERQGASLDPRRVRLRGINLIPAVVLLNALVALATVVSGSPLDYLECAGVIVAVVAVLASVEVAPAGTRQERANIRVQHMAAKETDKSRDFPADAFSPIQRHGKLVSNLPSLAVSHDSDALVTVDELTLFRTNEVDERVLHIRVCHQLALNIRSAIFRVPIVV